MKKVLLLLLALFTVVTLAACGGSGDTELVIFQNKVEIDAILREYADAWGEENGITVTVRSCGGDACAYGDRILTEFQGTDQPDIFVIEGLGGFNDFKDKILPFENQAWMDDTNLGLTVDGVVYGFPVNIEAWGMGYNKDILDAADIDPASLNSLAGYRAAFEKLDSMKAELGLTGVVGMAAGAGMEWVTGLHNFNGYLSAGLDYDDRSVIEDLLAGQPNMDRLGQLADWVELLFQYADQTILLEGTYDSQVGAFKDEKVAFIHQGNWIDPNLLGAPAIDFPVGYAPHASVSGTVDAIFVGAPSYYVINRDGNNTDAANQFLNDLALTQEGHRYMVEKANMVPAFRSVTLPVTAPLSAAANIWAQAGKSFAWFQNDMPSGFGMGEAGPIYFQYAQGNITKEEFVQRLADLIRTLQ
jgi:raffinose/stachyose/melibiose transport system substrate-binding protein